MTKNKIYSAILSVFIAFGLWLYVVNNISVMDTIPFYNVPVVMEGESILNERNLMVTGVSSKAVSLELSGARSELNKVDSGDIYVKVDLSDIDVPGEYSLNYSPSYPSDVAKSALTMETQNPASINITVDHRRNTEIPVQVKWTGTRSENYLYDTENHTLDYEMVTIVGPAEVADQIKMAVIEVDLTNQVESISESYRYTLCDKDGNPVDAEKITTNVEEVRLDMQIQRIKELKLQANVVYGGGATQDNTTIKVTPETIRVSGSEAVLAELGDVYTVCTLDLASIESSTNELNFAITLPEGVTNQTGVAEAEVSVRYTGLRTVEMVVDSFEIINVPEGMTAELINATLTIKVRGPREEMEGLTEEHIKAVVDFTNAEVGTATYKVKIVIDEAFPNVGALKTSAVSATVQAKE